MKQTRSDLPGRQTQAKNIKCAKALGRLHFYKRMNVRLIIIGALLMAIVQLKAQQTPLFNSALINPVLENPALAGANKYSQSFLHYKKQWLDFEGAPESALLSIDWPLKDEKSGLALIVSSDKVNILGHLGVMAAYSHDIKINEDQHLKLGLGLKLNYNTIYFDKVKAEYEYESALFNYSETATGFNGNFGLSYNYKALRAGLSVKNLMNSKLKYSNETEDKNLFFQHIPQYLLNLSYTYDINEDIWVKPEVALRDLQGMPVQFEASVLSTYQNKYSAGIVYRNKNSMGFLASMLIYDRLTVSYAYQAALGKISGYNGGTHEITLGYRFFTSHYQGFKSVDSEKLDELIEFSQKQVDENQTLKQSNEELKEEQKKLREDLKKEKEEVAKLIAAMKAERDNYNKVKVEDEIELADLPEGLIHDPNVPIYIILGVFSDTYQAKKFQQILKREHGIYTEVLKRKNSQDYIVCVNKKYDSKDSLRRELSKYKRVSSDFNGSEAWIYVNQ